jgi:biotin carboxylase
MAEERKKILILGAGRDQIPIIATAKKMGLFVIVVSPKGDYDGLKIADKVLYANILEKDYILDFAKKEGVDGVISDQLDIAVPTVAYVAEKLGLQGIGYECSQYFINKFLMRKMSEEIDIPVQKYRQVDNAVCGLKAANEIGFPVIIKPVDSTGSKGVFKVDNEAEFKEKFNLSKVESYSGKVLVEEFVKGEQYLSRGYVHDYRLRLFAFSNRYYFDLTKHFLPNQTIFPAIMPKHLKSRMEDYQNRIIEYVFFVT